jgi:hypothetical protein
MRKAKTTQKITYLAPDVQTKVVPAPVDGWDAISPLAEMDPKRAPILNNWVPRPGYVELRGGSFPSGTTGTTNPVESLMIYRSPTGEKMFAAAGGKIYDASATGGALATVVVSGLTNNRWQYVNFTSQGGTVIIQCVNGHDQMRQFDGTNWTIPSITGLPGGTTAGISNISLSMQRLWYVIANTTTVAYMPVAAIGGPVEGTLTMGPLWRHGGFLVTVTPWTIDGGQGPQNYTAFLSSRGEIALFAGDDPANPSSWQFVGTFMISPPLGLRCTTQLGSDVGIITLQGVLPISQVLPFDPSADRSAAITARIQHAMATSAQTGQFNFGWELTSFPAQQLLILNVPITENNLQVQFVMNALTGAWCQFTGWNANCFAIFNENLYWGGNTGLINQGYTGAQDYQNSIAADMQCAFNWFDEPGRLKRVTMLQPLLNVGTMLTPSIAVDADFQTSSAVATISNVAGGTLWDVGIWDVSTWATSQLNFSSWLTVDALGHALAVRMRINVTSPGTTTIGEFDIGVFDSAGFDELVGSTSVSLPILQVNAFNAIAEFGGPI